MNPNSDDRYKKHVASDLEKLIGCILLTIAAYFVFRYGYVKSNPSEWLYYLAFFGLIGAACTIVYRPLQLRIASALAPKNKNLEWDREVSSKFIAGAGVVVIGLMAALLCIDHVVHKHSNGASGNFLGTFGDFFGGVVNPILSFITLIALAFTFGMQRLQLIDARNQAEENKISSEKGAELAKLQAFETTFFHMLSLHHSTVEQLHYDSEAVFPILCDSEMRHADQLGKSRSRKVFSGVLATMDLGCYAGPSEGFSPVSVFEVIQKKHNYVLGHYFRHMYQILALIERTFPEQEKHCQEWRQSAPKKYSNVLRAQLSANELILLFFNCSGKLVDDGQFRSLVSKYELLEHLPLEFDISTNTFTIHDYDFIVNVNEYLEVIDGIWHPGAFGKNPNVLKALPDLQNPN